jgi:hypothetical protein
MPSRYAVPRAEEATTRRSPSHHLDLGVGAYPDAAGSDLGAPNSPWISVV